MAAQRANTGYHGEPGHHVMDHMIKCIENHDSLEMTVAQIELTTQCFFTFLIGHIVCNIKSEKLDV